MTRILNLGNRTPAESLSVVLRLIAAQLRQEADRLPGTILAYGRPHQHARNRFLPRWSRSGMRIPGTNRVRPDCPKPVKGRCECPPDGSWRPIGGSQRADQLARSAEFVETSHVPDAAGRQPGIWTNSFYHQGPDGLWRCERPTARAVQRVHGESARRFLVLTRLLAGDSVDEAWFGLGEVPDPTSAALSICLQVVRMADEEAATEWERRPRRWRAVPWTSLSESGQNAETNGGTAA